MTTFTRLHSPLNQNGSVLILKKIVADPKMLRPINANYAFRSKIKTFLFFLY